MEQHENSTHERLSRRARRLGLGFAGLGVLLALTFWSWYGLSVGALVAVCGLYMAYAYLPLARWVRSLEKRRNSADARNA